MAFFDSLVQREIEGWSSEEPTAPYTPSDSEINPNDAINNDGTA